MSLTKYTTIAGDRWDTVAYKAYGDVNQMGKIVEANPNIPKEPFLPEGITLYIPLKEREEVQSTALPPWKR